MDIKDILDSLGLDFTNPEAKRGAIEAIQAILDSRTPPPDLGGAGGGVPAPPEGIDVEIDPDLIQPSQKYHQSGNDDDIEIEDEEDILSQVKHNESEDELDNDENIDGDDSSDDSDSDSKASNSDNSSDSNKSSDADETEEDSDTNSSSDKTDEETAEENDAASAETNDDVTVDKDGEESEEDADEKTDTGSTDENDELEEPGEEEDEFDFDGEEKEVEAGQEPEESDEENEENKDEEEDASDFDFDEDDFIDDELQNSYDDQELKSKHEARKIKRERTLAAAKKALANAQAKNVSPALIRELEKSIEALESLVEAAQKNLKDISDEEFNLMINRVFDAISAVGDKDLTFTSDEERELKAQEIKADLGSRETQQALSDEDIAAIRAETQAVKAREKEIQQYKQPARNSFKGFQEFLNSLYRAIALQVNTNEVQDDTWSAINRRYSGTAVLKQGQRKNDLPDRMVPIIDFYFDQSGSWDENDILAGKKAVEALVDMEEKGQIKINIYYFSNHVFNDAQSARNEGGTRAWNEIVKNVITTKATNVVIMTDSDMEDWWEGQSYGKPALKYIVPGYVWYLWRNGESAPRLPRDLKGRGGVQQFSFNRGDA